MDILEHYGVARDMYQSVALLWAKDNNSMFLKSASPHRARRIAIWHFHAYGADIAAL
jgi:hypothetical protein